MKIIIKIISVCLLSFLCIACGEETSSSKLPAEHTIKIVCAKWDSDVASANVVKILLEKIGYQVEILQMNIADSWNAVANGKADVMLNAWLPDIHSEYYEKYKNKVENLGPNLIGTRVGLAVPEYVNVLTIDELNSYHRQFDGKIYGLNNKTILARKTEQAIQVYKLDYVYVGSNKDALLNQLNNAILAGDWIVITAWSPHWMFSKWNLKYLDDTELIYGNEGTINTIVRKGLSEEQPKAWQVLKNFYWDNPEIQSLMFMNHLKPQDIQKNTREWMDKNQELVKKWLRE